MKRSYIPFALSLAALLGAAGAGLFCPPVRSWAAGMFMLFQQRSAPYRRFIQTEVVESDTSNIRPQGTRLHGYNLGYHNIKYDINKVIF